MLLVLYAHLQEQKVTSIFLSLFWLHISVFPFIEESQQILLAKIVCMYLYHTYENLWCLNINRKILVINMASFLLCFVVRKVTSDKIEIYQSAVVQLHLPRMLFYVAIM